MSRAIRTRRASSRPLASRVLPPGRQGFDPVGGRPGLVGPGHADGDYYLKTDDATLPGTRAKDQQHVGRTLALAGAKAIVDHARPFSRSAV